jgi:hypothetical protein
MVLPRIVLPRQADQYFGLKPATFKNLTRFDTLKHSKLSHNRLISIAKTPTTQKRLFFKSEKNKRLQHCKERTPHSTDNIRRIPQ